MIPKFHELMLPLLECFGDGRSHDWQAFEAEIARKIHISEEDKNAEYPNAPGRKIFLDRLAWARTYLFKAKLINKVDQRRYYVLTERGSELLKKGVSALTIRDLKQYPDFWDTHVRNQNRNKDDGIELTTSDTPQENIIENIARINDLIREELAERISSVHPQLFEKLVVELLVKMGYGVGEVTRYTNDGGIDGIIKGDHLGFEKIYIQAKRWANNVGRKEVTQFVGDILAKNAKKGVFITTSDFNEDAVLAGAVPQVQIILINGEKLLDLMMQFGLGVTEEQVLKIYKLDSDFFDLY